MASRKPRKSKDNGKPTITLHLDPERWEEIGAIAVIILAALTALGAFNLSGGLVLDNWVHLLQRLLGWGVYLAPLLLLGLGIWLLLDSLDRIVEINWERSIALSVIFLLTVAALQWISAVDQPTRMPGAFQGGGLLGWAVLNLLVQLFGVAGALFALLALVCIALILFFNIPLAALVDRIGYLTRIAGWVARIAGAAASVAARSGDGLRSVAASLTALFVGRGESAPQKVARSRDLGEKAPAPVRAVPVAPPVAEPLQDEEDVEQTSLSQPSAALGEASATEIPEPVDEQEPAEVETPVPVVRPEYHLPEIPDILEEGTEQEINQQEIRARVRIIEDTLQHFGVPALVLEVSQGPTITQFGVEPGFLEQKGADGQMHRIKVKVSRISALQHDLELALAAAPIRIEAPVPGRNVVGIEVPNAQVSAVSLRGVIESEEFKKAKSKLRIALGQDVTGQPVCADLAKMPHLLIAGATGSGKSVCINSIIAALLCTATPDDVRFVMIDPKRVELVNFNDIPHLIHPVVTEVDNAVGALQTAVGEMDRRYKLFAEKGARNIETYNHMVEDDPDKRLPFYVLIVDELADLMMVAASQVEHAITRLAQMARATGIHLILATQRPSTDVVTGLIKANFPARISFAVTSLIDSRVVLDTSGAEKLLGRGDMLYMASDSSKLQRLQGCYVSDRELDRLVTFWRAFAPPAPIGPAIQLPLPVRLPSSGRRGEMGGSADRSGSDALLAQAIQVVKQSKKASVSLLQRKLGIGYSRAARLMEALEEQGIVGPDEGPTKGRAIRMSEDTLVQPSAPPVKAASPRRDAEPDDAYADWTEKDWEELDK